MKSSRNLPWSELKVGIIIMAAIFLLAVGILQMGGRGIFTKTYTLYLYLENTFGLKVGGTVRLAGVDVGSLDDISFPADPKDKKIIVKLVIDQRYSDRIKEDSRANIRTLGLLGDKYIDIEMGSPESPELKDGGEIKGGPETQINRVISGASTGLEGLNTVLGQVKDMLGDVSAGQGTAGKLFTDAALYNELRDAATSIDTVATELQGGKGSLGKLVREPELYNNLLNVSAKAKDLLTKLDTGSIARLSEDKTFYENLKDVSVNLKDVTENAKSLVNNLESGNIAKLSRDKELYAKLDRVSTRLDAVMAKIESGEGSAAKLINDKKLYDNMNKFFEDADELVLDFKKQPKKYIHISIF